MSTAPQAVLDLVERFERNIDDYRDPSYNETQARHMFIDPFFAAPMAKELLQHQIDATDRQIDRLGY